MEDTMTCMPCAHVVVLKTDGTEGGKYPLHEDAMIGRSVESEIRVRLPTVSRKHCLLKLRGNKVYLHNLAELNPSLVNDEAVTNFKKLGHGDVFAIGDRRFRLEYTGFKGGDYENTIADEDATLPMGSAAFKTFAGESQKTAATPRAVEPFGTNTSIPNTPKAVKTPTAKPLTPAPAKSARKKGLPTPILRAIQKVKAAQAGTPKPAPTVAATYVVEVIASEQPAQPEDVPMPAFVDEVPATETVTTIDESAVTETASVEQTEPATVEAPVASESTHTEAAPAEKVVVAAAGHLFFGSPEFVPRPVLAKPSSPVSEPTFEPVASDENTVTVEAMTEELVDDAEYDSEGSIGSDYDTCDEEEFAEAKKATHLFFSSPGAPVATGRRLSSFTSSRISFGTIKVTPAPALQTPAACASTPCSPVNMSSLEADPTPTPAAAAISSAAAIQSTPAPIASPTQIELETVSVASPAVEAVPVASAPQVDTDVAAIQAIIAASPVAVVAAQEPAPTARILPTPVRNAIKNRRKTGSSSLTVEPVPVAAAPFPKHAAAAPSPKHAAAAPSPKHAAAAASPAHAKKANTPAAKGLPTPVRNEIKKRQRSTPAPEQAAEPAPLLTLPIPAAEAPLVQRILPTPIRNAIKSRKVSTAAKPAAVTSDASEVISKELVFETAHTEQDDAIEEPLAIEAAALTAGVETEVVSEVVIETNTATEDVCMDTTASEPVDTIVPSETAAAIISAPSSPGADVLPPLPPRSSRKTAPRTAKSAKKGIAIPSEEVTAIPMQLEAVTEEVQTESVISASAETIPTEQAIVEAASVEPIGAAPTEHAIAAVTATEQSTNVELSSTIETASVANSSEATVDEAAAGESTVETTTVAAEETSAPVEAPVEASAEPVVIEASADTFEAPVATEGPLAATPVVVPASTSRSTRKTAPRSTKSAKKIDTAETPASVQPEITSTAATPAVAESTPAIEVDSVAPSATVDVAAVADAADACEVCGDEETSDDNLLLLCDKCDKGFHQACVGIDVIPEGDWFCASCDVKPAAKKRGRKEAAPKTPASSKKRAAPEPEPEVVEPVADAAPSVDVSHLVGTDLDKMTVVALKQELKNFGLAVIGIKKELVTRLEEFIASVTAPVAAAAPVVPPPAPVAEEESASRTPHTARSSRRTTTSAAPATAPSAEPAPAKRSTRRATAC